MTKSGFTSARRVPQHWMVWPSTSHDWQWTEDRSMVQSLNRWFSWPHLVHQVTLPGCTLGFPSFLPLPPELDLTPLGVDCLGLVFWVLA